MNRISRTAFGAVAGGLFCATPALAELDAAEVWQNWQDYAAQFGQTLTGTQSMSGDTLTISDVRMDMTMPEGSVNGALDALMLTENGDGSVTVTASPEMTLTIAGRPNDDEPVDMVMKLRNSGLAVTATEADNANAYDFAAEMFSLETVEMVIDGQPADMNISAAMTDIAGNYLMSTDAGGAVVTESSAATFAMEVKGTDPESGDRFDMQVSMADMTSRSISNMPGTETDSDMSAMLAAGFSTDGQARYGDLSFALSGDSDGEQFEIQGTAEGGGFDFVLNAQQMAYAVAQQGLNVALSGSEIPMPQVTAQMAESRMEISMPVAQSAEPMDFGTLLSLKGLSIGEEVWSMFDPAAMLPRDPATLVIDLAGTGNWLMDIMAEQPMPPADGRPGELHSLDIQELELSVAGARLTGDGSFTFDNSDLATYDGMPKPVGTANFRLTGGNGLLDTAVQMGLLPEDQAMGVRMMTGMVARPGDGADTLVSEIELTEDGQVLANGQRLK